MSTLYYLLSGLAFAEEGGAEGAPEGAPLPEGLASIKNERRRFRNNWIG